MSGCVSLLNVLDVARSLGPDPLRATPELVANWLLSEYLERTGGGFNYNPATNEVPNLFCGRISEEQAVRSCLTRGNPKGRQQNADAIKQVAPFAISNISTCYRIKFAAVSVGRVSGRTIYVAIKAPLVRVQGRNAFVVMPGFRMSHRPMEPEIDVACSIALASLARGDFAGSDFEYLYAGPGLSGKREFRVIHGKDRRIYDSNSVDHLLDVYVKGVAIVLASGRGEARPSLGGYRIIDPDSPSMF